MMTRREVNSGILASAALAVASTTVGAKERKPMELPPPRTEGGMPLIAALKLRRSIREYSAQPLSAQTLSDLVVPVRSQKHI